MFYTLNSKEICPYCGNSLQGNKLVESYVVMFCENFIQYTKDVERLQNIKTSTSQFDELKNIINSNLIKIKDLTPKIFDASISSIHRDIEDLSYCLLQEIEDIINIKHKIDKQVESCIDLKLKNKYESIKKVDIAGYQDIKKKINDIIINYNTKLEEYNKHSAEYIGNLTIESINTNIANLEKEYTENINIFNRNKYNDKYEEYLKNLVKIKENEKKSLNNAKMSLLQIWTMTSLMKFSQNFSKNAKNVSADEKVIWKCKARILSKVWKNLNKFATIRKINYWRIYGRFI